jgi:pyruvate kinase
MTKMAFTKLSLSWGVSPVLVCEEKKTVPDLFGLAESLAMERGCETGDIIVVTIGFPIQEKTNLMKIVEIGESKNYVKST